MSVVTGYRIRAWGEDPVWEQFERTPPRAGEAVVAVDACGVGLTVLNAIQGDLTDDRATLPRVPGHELVGRVVETGAGVPTDLLGRLVAAYFYLSCGSCPECVAGEDNRCRRLAGYVGVHLDGGYGSVVTLPARNLIPMPDGLDPIAATVVPDAVATPVHICRNRARVGPGGSGRGGGGRRGRRHAPDPGRSSLRRGGGGIGPVDREALGDRKARCDPGPRRRSQRSRSRALPPGTPHDRR